LPKKKVNLYINTEIWNEIKRLAFQKHENFHGALSTEVEEAFTNWIALHTQNHTKGTAINKINPQPKAYNVFTQVKEYMKQNYGYVSISSGQQVPDIHLVGGIAAVRGDDPRTLSKWIKSFIQFKIIKKVSKKVFEVI
jgi:hypothetical protein